MLADAPHHLAYELTDFQKLFGKLVRNARTDWRFAEAPGGTSVDWQYEFHALPGRGWLVGLIQGLFWAPYMRKVLPGIARQVERPSVRSARRARRRGTRQQDGADRSRTRPR